MISKKTLTLAVVLAGVAGAAFAAPPIYKPGHYQQKYPWDINGDGKTNGADWNPAFLADLIGDINWDGKANGKDFAPGQNK